MQENVHEHNQAQPSTKRLYKSLGLWIFLYLTIISAGFYIIAVDSSFEPDKQIKQNVIKSSASPTNEASKMIKQNSINSSVTMITNDEGLQSIDEN